MIESDALSWSSPASLLDLGIGGACVQLGEPLPLGTSVRLKIDSPQLWEPLAVLGRVAWSRQLDPRRALLGVRFEPDSAESILTLLELLAPSSS